MKPVQLASGAWRARVYIGKDESGKSKFVSVTRASRNECIRDAADIAIHHREIVLDKGNMTLDEAIDDYITLKSNILSPSTIRGYDIIRRNNLQPEMEMKLRNITNDIAQKAINREAASKSPKTVANIAGLLNTVINYYLDRTLKIALPKRAPREPNVFTEDEMKTFIRLVDGHPMENIILLALMLGLRRSEILGLTKEDYDPKSRLLRIHQSVVQNKNGDFVRKQTTKTRSSTRTLIVPEYLAVRLEKAFERDGIVCTYHPSSYSEVIGDFCEANGLPRLTLHDLRRQNASVMLSLGIADKYAMERGGWSSTQIMKNIYQMTMSDKRIAVDLTVNAYFEELAKVDTPAQKS